MSRRFGWHSTDLGWQWSCPFEECDGSGFISAERRVFTATKFERTELVDHDCRCRASKIAEQPGLARA